MHGWHAQAAYVSQPASIILDANGLTCWTRRPNHIRVLLPVIRSRTPIPSLRATSVANKLDSTCHPSIAVHSIVAMEPLVPRGILLASQERNREILERQKSKKPFYTEDLLIGPPKRTWQDFQLPRLRRCPFDLEDILWERRLGGGLDGYSWRVKFGQRGPFVLKVVRQST